MTFTVAIVGRPNVGKSTLYNRFVGGRHALVDDTPGVTRDRREGDGALGPLRFKVIDTAGLMESAPDSLVHRMQAQTAVASDAADVTLLVVDGRAGITPDDKHFAGELRRHGGAVVVIVNKCEGHAGDAGYYEAHALGMGEPVAICQWRSKKGPPRRCKKGPLGGCGLVPVVHGRAPRATRRALNRLTRRRAREGPVGPRGQAWAGWSVQLAVGV